MIVTNDLIKKNPMCPEIKQQWVEALRSGKYKQGSGCLRQIESDGQETYCCLGVLCEIYHQTTGLGEWVKISQDQLSFQLARESSATTLPELVREWAGLFLTNPSIPYDGDDNKISSAIALNDTYALSFDEIAALIEAGL